MMMRFAAGLGVTLALLGSSALAATLGVPTNGAQPSQNVANTGFPPSGKTALKCALTAAAQTCGPFYPIPGRGFNAEGSGTFVAGYQLERLLPGEIVWKPITAAGTQLYVWTAPASESNQDDEWGAAYRINVTSYTSGTLNVRLSQ